MLVVSISDVHLNNFSKFAQPTDNQAVNSRLATTMDAVEYAYQTGVKHGAKMMIINGDFFDVRQSFSVSATAYIMQRLQQIIKQQPNGFTTIFNVGNHDELGRHVEPNSVSMFKVLNTDNHPVKVIDKVTTYTYDDCQLLFVPYQENIKQSKQQIKEHLVQLTKPTTVFAHVGITGSATGRWGLVLNGSYSVDDFINDKVKAVVVGHYHTRNYLQPKIKLTDYHCEDKAKLMKYGKVDCWYQGDLLPINFNDVKADGTPAPRGFDLVDTVTGEHQFFTTNKFPQFYIVDNETLLSKIDEYSKDNYVQLVTEDTDLAKQYLTNKHVSVKLIHDDIKQTNDLNLTTTSSNEEIVTKYCQKYAPQLTDLALSYLKQAQKQLTK